MSYRKEIVSESHFNNSRDFFTLPIREIGDGKSTPWQLFCKVMNNLDSEIESGYADGFVCLSKTADSVSNPINTISESVKYIRYFQELISFLGQSSGFVDLLPYERSQAGACRILDNGRDGINHLTRSFIVVNDYYNSDNLTLMNKDEMLEAVAFLDQYFYPEKHEWASKSLESLKMNLFTLEEKIMKMDHGPSIYEYKNLNGQLTFFQDGAIHVTVDSERADAVAEWGANEQLIHKYHSAVLKHNIVTNSGGFDCGVINTFNIPQGVDIYQALEVLFEAEFISKRERDMLLRNEEIISLNETPDTFDLSQL